jgi:phage terminase small subunit
MPKPKGLSPKQARFVDEYLKDLNATQAAIRAEYSAKTAAIIGFENLRKPNIAAKISEAQKKLAEAAGVTQEWIVEELRKIASSNMLDFIEVDAAGIPRLAFSKLTPDRAAALAEVRFDRVMVGKGEDAVAVDRIKIKLHDKRAALVSLGQHLGMFVTRHKHEGGDGGPIIHEHRSAVLADISRLIGARRSDEAGGQTE